MATSPQAFYCLWQKEAIREKLFDLLSTEDICAVRAANSACCNLVTKRLFLRTNLTFTANSFTKPSRIQALSRIGHHIEHLTFHLAHSDATFLPPLIHPSTGKEITFLYTPHTSMASVLSRPKYGNSELGDILTQQYPPLFHAATNVPSFINAVKHMTNMRHLTIKTPGQDPKERYRRDIVDYALISLRITLERTTLAKLAKLSLSSVHPSAFTYLRPVPGFGCSPGSTRKLRQIRKLYISVESWDFYGPSPGLDHLKIMDDYIRLFAPTLEKFTFAWHGRRGPCPLALSADPLFAPPRNAKKLFAEVTSPMSPLPPRPSRRPLVMPRLRYMQVRNATMNTPQLRDLVATHKRSVREFDFENVVLINNGSWDEALEPLQDCSRESWSRHSIGESVSSSHTRPELARSRSGSASAVTSTREDEQLPTPSAAAAAATQELLDVDLEGMALGGPNDVDVLEAGVEEWALGVAAAAQAGSKVSLTPTLPAATENGEEERLELATDGGLASDIEAAREASVAFSTKLKKRIRKKRSRHHHHRGDEDADAASDGDEAARRSLARSDTGSSSRRDKSKTRHKHSRSTDDAHERSHSRHHHHRRRRQTTDERPELPRMPAFIAEVLPSDDETVIARLSPRKPTLSRNNSCNSYFSGHSRHRPVTPPQPMPTATATATATPAQLQTPTREMDISAPILNSDPLPVLLQPTVYDPSARSGPFMSNYGGSGSSMASLPCTPPPLVRTLSNKSTATVSTPGDYPSTPVDDLDDGLSPVQRHIEAELLLEAEEAAARTGALKRAREAVIAKLTKEFCRRKGPSHPHGKDSAAVMGVAGFSALSLGTVFEEPADGAVAARRGYGGNGGAAREGPFGRSVAQGLNLSTEFVAVSADPRTSDHGSSTALVPLMFSRG